MLLALRYGTCFDKQKRSHSTYVIVYVSVNFPLQFCVPVVDKKSHAPINVPLQDCVPVVHKKSHATYVIVYAPMNPLQFCVPVVHKNLMQLYTCSSCPNRFLSTSVLFHLATCS